ncbi:MAG TPA: hypothetical protein PLN52_09420, partial [Opitutaceae bacterium]|nr:hypothetical protein [Opitutaceae bacterium]
KLTEEAFVMTRHAVSALVAAGDKVVVSDRLGSSSGYQTIHSVEGKVLFQQSSYEQNTEYVWSNSTQRLYSYRNGGGTNEFRYVVVNADGTLGEYRQAPYVSGASFMGPLRISPDGVTVLSGAGHFYDGATLVQNNALANGLLEAVWLESRVYTARQSSTGGKVEVQRWGGPNYGLDATHIISGEFVALRALPSGDMVLVTQRNGTPLFTTLNAGLGSSDSTGGAPPDRLGNLSTRALTVGGEGQLIPGIIISGSQNKKVLVRAAGPVLAEFGVENALADPELTLLDWQGKPVAVNDNWSSATNAAEIASASARVGAFAFPSGSKDSALLLELKPGNYTALTRNVSGSPGIALVEVYDVPDSVASSLVNLSARGTVGQGGDVLISGLIVTGSSPKSFLIRGVGPTLADFKVNGALADPHMRLYRQSEVIQENDNWEDGRPQEVSFVERMASQVGAFPLPAKSKDAAMVVTLEPGAYTVHLSAATGAGGVALIEVYEVEF